jgi:hypothetical protein
MPAEDNNLLGAEPSRGDDAAQADGAVTDNGHCVPWTNLRPHGRMVAGAHDI